VQYPSDFIKSAYEMIRAKGGVCIADEVSTCKVYTCLTTRGQFVASEEMQND